MWTKYLLVVLGALVIVDIQPAYGNGRKPPRTVAAAQPAKAVCTKKDGAALEIFRVKLTSGEGSTEPLKVSIAGTTEQFSITEVQQISFRSSQVNRDGFVKAEIRFTDERSESAAMVRTRSGRSNVQLTGYKSQGAPISIDMTKCQTIQFESGTPDSDIDHPGEAKH
jgi:hypothetical protein